MPKNEKKEKQGKTKWKKGGDEKGEATEILIHQIQDDKNEKKEKQGKRNEGNEYTKRWS